MMYEMNFLSFLNCNNKISFSSYPSSFVRTYLNIENTRLWFWIISTHFSFYFFLIWKENFSPFLACGLTDEMLNLTFDSLRIFKLSRKTEREFPHIYEY